MEGIEITFPVSFSWTHCLVGELSTFCGMISELIKKPTTILTKLFG